MESDLEGLRWRPLFKSQSWTLWVHESIAATWAASVEVSLSVITVRYLWKDTIPFLLWMSRLSPLTSTIGEMNKTEGRGQRTEICRMVYHKRKMMSILTKDERCEWIQAWTVMQTNPMYGVFRMSLSTFRGELWLFEYMTPYITSVRVASLIAEVNCEVWRRFDWWFLWGFERPFEHWRVQICVSIDLLRLAMTVSYVMVIYTWLELPKQLIVSSNLWVRESRLESWFLERVEMKTIVQKPVMNSLSARIDSCYWSFLQVSKLAELSLPYGICGRIQFHSYYECLDWAH